LDLFITKDLKSGSFGSAHSEGVAGAIFGSCAFKELSFDTLLGDVERHPNSYDAAVVLNHPIAFLSRCNVREGKNAGISDSARGLIL